MESSPRPSGDDAPGLETHHLSENQDVWVRDGKTEHAAKVLVPPRDGDVTVAIRWSGNLKKDQVLVGSVRPMHSPGESRCDDATNNGRIREGRTRRSQRRSVKPDRLGTGKTMGNTRQRQPPSRKQAPPRPKSAVETKKRTGRRSRRSAVQGAREVPTIGRFREAKRAKELQLLSRMKTLRRLDKPSSSDDDGGGGAASEEEEGGGGVFLGSRHVDASPFPATISVVTTGVEETGDGDDADRRELYVCLEQRHRAWTQVLNLLGTQIAERKQSGRGAEYARECEEERDQIRSKLRDLSDRIYRLRHPTSQHLR